MGLPVDDEREVMIGVAERIPRPLHDGLGAKDLLPRFEGTGLQPGHGEQLADHAPHPIGLVGDGQEVVPRGIGEPFLAAELRRHRPDARQRGLEVVGDPAQEVGLDRGHPVQLIGLRAEPSVEQRLLDRPAHDLGHEAEQISLGRGWRGRLPTVPAEGPSVPRRSKRRR